MASLQPSELSVPKVSSLHPLLSAFNLHWWTKLVIKFTTIVNLTWFTVVDCGFSCIPDFVFIQLHSKSTDLISHYMFTKPLLLHLLFSSSETQFALPVLIRIWEKQSEESRIKGCFIYNRLYCCRWCGVFACGCSVLWRAARSRCAHRIC